jgi:pilus assembly protein CpaF
LIAENRPVLVEDTGTAAGFVESLVPFEARRACRLAVDQHSRLVAGHIAHRPERILVGDVPGGEAFDLFQALNTSSLGTLSTIHANSAEQALHRFTSSVLQSRVDLSHPAIGHGQGDASALPVHQALRLLTDGDALGTRRAGTTGSDLE